MSFEETQNVLEEFAESKLILVVLHVDLVGSTRLTMTLPIDRIATIIQAFYQEMSVLITAYGGYVLKYIGDAILAFFLVSTDVSLSCANAVYCARSIIKVMQQGINPILSQYDYPEINVRIGIDVGKNTVRCGWDVHTNNTTTYSALRKEETKNSNDNNNKKVILIKKPVYDVLGYAISITAKMTALAKPNKIVIGELVYDALDKIDQKSTFQLLHIDHEIWDYVSDYTGDVYRLYGSI
jgi:adenylate cyclase